ncbi:MAG: ChaN family lipoprotein [Halopseudomonas sp.]|uniref:ChaN family lipoprotein n=1 Tax=Halopseudomonas sp. TaxID=2901191 RepID=UPI0030029763
MKTLLWLLLVGFAAALGAAELPVDRADSPGAALDPGRVWDTRAQHWLDAAHLPGLLARSPYVVIGEKHDNPDHHRLQLWLLQQLQAMRPQGALLMEMLQPGQQAAINALQHKPLPPATRLRQQLDWQPGWDWTLYGPLVHWGLAQPQRLLAADLAPAQLRHRYQRPPPVSTRYPAPALRELKRVLRESHCGKLAAERLPAMLAIQQGRDEQMARLLAEAPTPALLLAGSYHARRDLGAPLHWRSNWGPLPTVVLLQETGQSALPDARQADFVWLTPAAPEQDYCAAWDKS